MNHRKFQQRLDELLTELTYAQARKVIAALQQRGDGGETQRLLEQRLEGDPKCAHCGSRRIEGHDPEKSPDRSTLLKPAQKSDRTSGNRHRS